MAEGSDCLLRGLSIRGFAFDDTLLAKTRRGWDSVKFSAVFELKQTHFPE